MNIKDIQTLIVSDFETYKNTMLSSQKALLDQLNTENIFISALGIEELKDKIDQVQVKTNVKKPLLGIPFAVKDNIDVAGFETTAGCKEYSYTPSKSAFTVKTLEQAGAICIGKTNMDQFATGLVGTRSPYGIAKNYYNEEYIPGGSSSGSASALTSNYACFSLGTDTAGSGRVPAAFQNLIGVKPSKGIISTCGVVPACKSLDCVSVFANKLEDAELVLKILSAYDEQDPYSRSNQQAQLKDNYRIAIPLKENLKFFGNSFYEGAFNAFIESLRQHGYNIAEIDFSPMFDAAKLLYNGPWVAERFHAVGEFIEKNPAAILQTTKTIILGGKTPTASQYFDAEYQLKKYEKLFDNYTQSFDAFVMPTAGTIYKIEEVKSNPIELNSNLGYYTNFMNLLDCSALALPVTITENNLPFGVTLFAPAFNDLNLLNLGKKMAHQNTLNLQNENTELIDLAVCGAHKREGVLNYQLKEIGAIYKRTTLTSESYRFYALENLSPVRPGLVCDPGHGSKIEVEIWKVPASKLGGFINSISAPLSFGKITLENGEQVTSFLCELYALDQAKEITHLQRWENYLVSYK